MRSALRGPAHQLAVPVRMRINIHGHNKPAMHRPCASNCACAGGLHFSAFHYKGRKIKFKYCSVSLLLFQLHAYIYHNNYMYIADYTFIYSLLANR